MNGNEQFVASTVLSAHVEVPALGIAHYVCIKHGSKAFMPRNTSFVMTTNMLRERSLRSRTLHKKAKRCAIAVTLLIGLSSYQYSDLSGFTWQSDGSINELYNFGSQSR